MPAKGNDVLNVQVANVQEYY